ncbi:MAG: helix-turn-helix transcriptional regulator [Acutalibacteraceae bacterium]|nr:helix-turn-helix transcriptional regulator [Acutalibacteraceae bacterium]
MFDKNKLKAKMVEKGYSVEQIAQKLGINSVTVYRKLSGETEFTRNEIAMLKSILSLTIEEIDNIFFA